MRTLTFLVLLTATIGCGPSAPPKFSEVQTRVFSVSCTFSACHDAASSQQGLNLSVGSAYSNLVNAPATGPMGNRVRVIPGDVKNSYLIEKLTSTTPAAGARMPSNGDPLEPDRLQLVEDWIMGGAKND
jgi:hypothetical protein